MPCLRPARRFRRAFIPRAVCHGLGVLPFLCLALLLAPSVRAQDTGGLTGTVLDGWEGRPLGGVAVLVRGTTLAVTTDGQGRYELNGVPPGEQTVRFSRSGYAASVVTGVRIAPGQVTRLDGTLRPEFYEMEEYEVTAEVFQEQAVNLLQDRQDAGAILEAIGSDQFRKLGVSDAADIMTKVTGTTVVDGKFAVIRGLGDRYNVTLLNGAEIPTADPYRRAAQLDLIPSAMIEQVIISKTFTPDLPGGFAGGAANIITRSFPDKFTFSITLGLEGNTQATFNDDYLTYPGGGTDWAGFDDGTRALPDPLANVTPADLAVPPRLSAETPEQAQQRRAQADRVQELLNSFQDYTFAPTTKTPPPNYGGSLSIGDTIELGAGRFGYFGNVTYQQKYNFFDNGFQQRFRNAAVDADPYEYYVDARSVSEVQWSAVINLAYELNEEHEFGFNFIYNRSAEDIARRQVGARPENLSGAIVDRSTLQWIERDLMNFQMRGSHGFPKALDMRVDWLISIAGTSQDEPDQRYFNYGRNEDFTGNFIDNNSLPEPSVPTRNYRNLEENNLSARFDDTVPFSPWDGLQASLKFGTFLSFSHRDFFQRSYGFGITKTNANQIDPWELAGTPNTFFTPENLRYSTYPGSRGATNYYFPRAFKTDSFGNYASQGDLDVVAGYWMVDMPFSPWLRLIGGLRPENTDLSLVSSDGGGSQIQRLDLLPAFSAVITLVTNMNVRLSYSSTIARPTFREIDPVENYDPIGDEIVRGNPNLVLSDITNWDVRWEWFWRPGSVISVSLFSKDIENAIEKVLVTFGGGIVTFENRPTADLHGLEFEARTGLDLFHEEFREFSLGFNLSLIESEVPLTTDEQINDPNAGSSRPLYDQSPWIVNADLTWDHAAWGTTATVAFNQAGPRIFAVDRGGPDVYEHPVPGLDFILSQKLSKNWRLRFSAKNLLDPEYRRTYGDSFDDKLYSVRTAGRTFGLAVTYDF